jgi:hypothetical protein
MRQERVDGPLSLCPSLRGPATDAVIGGGGVGGHGGGADNRGGAAGAEVEAEHAHGDGVGAVDAKKFVQGCDGVS